VSERAAGAQPAQVLSPDLSPLARGAGHSVTVCILVSLLFLYWTTTGDPGCLPRARDEQVGGWFWSKRD
jgi:hypothetical protein